MKQGELYYAGTVVSVDDVVLYEITVDIPGIIDGVKAYPMRGEVDEPRVGDFVMLKCLDPTFQSYYLYQKIKENDFIGFRSNGKMVDITPDYIQLATFSGDYNDNNGHRPEATNWVKLYANGDLEVDCTGNVTINSEGTLNIKSNTETIIQAPSIQIKGPGTLTCKGSVVPGDSGPFIATPVTPQPGAPFPQGDTIILS